jgi:MerR family transcriptional regulator, repressor of the yfmOP operon
MTAGRAPRAEPEPAPRDAPAPSPLSPPPMQIGEVAERMGVTQRTLRYWESIGLLPPAHRLEGGFRLYTESDLRRLEQIVELKRLLRISLAEIKQIVEAEDVLQQIRSEDKQDPDPGERRARTERAIGIIGEQLLLVRSRVEAMQQLEARYQRRLERLTERLARLNSPTRV